MSAEKEIKINLEDMFPIIAEKIAAGGSFSFGPKGISMLPLIKQGEDSVVISPVTGRLKKYDVPLYRRENGQFVLHRVVGVRRHSYVMCGDNQYDREYGITDKNIIGIMTKIKKPDRVISVTDSEYKKYSVKRVRYQYFRGKYIKLKKIIKKLIRWW